jgi:hypothetical protein
MFKKKLFNKNKIPANTSIAVDELSQCMSYASLQYKALSVHIFVRFFYKMLKIDLKIMFENIAMFFQRFFLKFVQVKTALHSFFDLSFHVYAESVWKKQLLYNGKFIYSW